MADPESQSNNTSYDNHAPPEPRPITVIPPDVRGAPPSLNVSMADSDALERGSMRTEDMSDYGADREFIGMRYACPNLGCGTPEKQVYSNPKYQPNPNPANRKKYPTLDRPPSRAASQSTVHSTNQSTADLVGKKGEPAQPDSGAVSHIKRFCRDPRYDKLRVGILIVLLVIVLLLIIILPIVYRKPADETPVKKPFEYETVTAPLAVCNDLPVEGYKKDGVAEFRGIPYAVPPLNERRWLPSEIITPNNCRDLIYTKADHFGHQCYQSVKPHPEWESEDCLYLNIWTPSNNTAAKKLPVMVYIHEGDFRTGSGNGIDQYPLRKVTTEGQFVLVGFNYRLQALGFMALDQLANSNVGLSDMVAALTWVQKNIAGFGGDESKVTLFGLGSGATSILALLNSKAAEGLFHRAWLMSPGIVQDTNLAISKVANQAFIANLGCPGGNDAEATRKCLYSKTPSEIMKAVQWNEGPKWAQPGKFDIPVQNDKVGAYIVADSMVGDAGTFAALRGQTLLHKNIPVVIGSGDADADVRPPHMYFGDGSEPRVLSDQQLTANVTQRLQAFDAGIMARIQNDYPNLETELGFTRLVTDIRALCPANNLADLMHKMGMEVYRYVYTLEPAMPVKAFNYDFWAKHTFQGLDMLAFFNALDSDSLRPYFADFDSFAKELRAQMFRFIKGETLQWSRMPSYMSLSRSANVANDANTVNYPRNCTHWADMIPEYSWSN